MQETERLDFASKLVRKLLLQLDVVDDLTLQWNQLSVDEAANVLLQKAKLFRKLEIHFFALSRTHTCGRTVLA